MIDINKLWSASRPQIPLVYDESLSYLESIARLKGGVVQIAEQSNENKENLNKKVSFDDMNNTYKLDQNADFKGSWFGIKKPTASNEGLASVVDQIKDESIPNINNQINKIVQIFIKDYKREVYEVDDTGRFQRAINHLIDVGGGIILLGIENFKINGSVYVKPTNNIPIKIQGVNLNFRQPQLNNCSIIERDRTGTIFYINLKEDNSSYLPITSQFTNFEIDGVGFKNTTWNDDISSKRFGVVGMCAINVFRTRGVYKNISSYGFDYTIYQPIRDKNSAENYCDMSVYENIQVLKCTNIGIETVRGDNDLYLNIYSEDCYVTFKNLLNIRLSGSFNIMNSLNANWGDWQGGVKTYKADESDESAIYRIEGSNGFINGIYTEHNYNTSLIKVINSNVEINNLYERYEGKNLVWNENSNVVINGVVCDSERINGYYDIKNTGTKSINRKSEIKNHKLSTSFSNKTLRKPLINDINNCLILKDFSVNLRVAFTGSSWIVRDLDNNDLSPSFPVQWDISNNDGLIFTGLTSHKGIFLQERRVAGQESCRPVWAQDSPLKISFLKSDGSRFLTESSAMNFYVQLIF